MSLKKRIKHNQMQDRNQLIIAIRRLLPCYTNNITDEHLAVVSNLIEAIRTDRTDKILQLLEPFDNDLKDELLSMGGMYLREHNMSITYSTAKFLHITLLSFRFYFPAVQLELVTKEENENILKYLIKHMDVILIWNGPTNQILLYHIKQVIFIANEVRFIAEVRKLLWGKLIFYMQQFIKYFTSKENIHFLQIGFISVKNLIDFIRLFKTGIECVYSKRPKSLKSVLKENESIMLHFEETYNNIRDIYVLVRIENNISRIFLRTSFLEDLRVLQILGECFKQTHATPNISPTFKQFITSYISEPCITALVTLRDSISHLTGVPVCSIEFIDEVEYLLQKIQVRCDSFIYNYVAEIKIKILNIIKSNNFENIELPCCCNLKLKPNLYNLFKDTQFRKPSRFHPELEPYEIIAINEQIQTFELIQFDKCLRKLHDALEYNHEYRIIEMLLMLILNHLNEDQKRLNTNRKWYMEKYPTLTGQQLRNHLAHGDPIVELLGLNEEIAVRDTAKLLTEELHMDVNAKRGNIQKITERIEVKRMEEIDCNKLISLEKYCKVFGCIMEGNLNKLKRHIQKIDSAWINWRDSNGRNALQCAAQNKNDDVAVFDFIYDKEKNTVNVKPSQETRDTPIFLAVLVKNYKIAKHIAEKHILALLKRDKNELGLDHLERCVASTLMLKTIALDDVWILCYYAICCNNAVQLQSILDLYYYKTLDNIWKANTSFLHIACAYGATEVVKYLINIGCNLNCVNNEKETSLSVAIHCGHEEIIEILLKNGAIVRDINSLDDNNQMILQSHNTELHNKLWSIIESGRIDEFNEFTQNQIEVFGPSRFTDGMNCLHFAVQSNNVDLVKQIYDTFPHLMTTCNKNGQTPVVLAFELQSVAVLNLIGHLIINDCLIRMEGFKQFVSYMLKETNCAFSSYYVKKTFLSNTLNVMEKYPNEKMVQYWASKLSRIYLKDVDISEIQVEKFHTVFMNTIHEFSTDEFIQVECITLFLKIFFYSDRLENYKSHLIDAFNSVLEQIVLYPQVVHILENFHKPQLPQWKCELLSSHALSVIDIHVDVSAVQLYALHLIYFCVNNWMVPDANMITLQARLQIVLSAFGDNSIVLEICATLFVKYFLENLEIVPEDVDKIGSTLESEFIGWEISDFMKKKLKSKIEKNLNDY